MQLEEAERLALNLSIPMRDAMHAIVARDNCALMVTNDKHFEKLRGITEIKRYGELI